MKRRLCIGLGIVLGALALLTGLYWWAQRTATRVMNEKLREHTRQVVSNPENLTVTNAPITLKDAKTATIPSMHITGHDVKVKQGITVQSLDITIEDVEVGAQSPVHVGAGSFELMLSDEELTRVLRERTQLTFRGARISLVDAVVTLSRQQGVVIAGSAEALGRTFPVTVRGTLIPDEDSGGIRFTPTAVDVHGLPGIGQQLLRRMQDGVSLPSAVNPAFVRSVDEVEIGDGIVTVRGPLDTAKFQPSSLGK